MVYYFYFLSVFHFIGMLLVGGRDFHRLWYPAPFMGCIFIYRKLVRFVSFMGPSALCLSCLIGLLSPLAFYSLAHLWRFIVNFFFCKAVDVVVLFIYRFRKPISFCWARYLIILNNKTSKSPSLFVGPSSLWYCPPMDFKSSSPFVKAVGFFGLVFVQD